MNIDGLTAALADRYRIERELGQGGMATVYLATDLRHERQVAIKVLRPDLSASIGSDRFLQEIRIAARLSHPHILPLHDSGEAAGLLFYVMPYVPGESLRQRIAREGELPVPDAVRILRDVTDALSYAHEHGVVHRDIKPENILLSGRHALVADFGVAKAVSEATGRSRLTTAGVALGTPSYMAPEQAVADPHVDHRADIYAVGIVGYEMIAGEPPFTGSSPQQILAAQVTEAPRPVTARRPAVPTLVADAVMRCLEKKPADRWQSAGDLLAQLEAAQTPTGGSTPTDTRPIAATRARRSPRLVAGAAGLLLVAAALVVWRRSSSSRAPAAPAVSVRDRTQLTFTGHVQSPAISPDGKQLAYVTKECDETRCAYGVDVQDVGGTTTRRVLAGAASAYFVEWSPDRRNLLVTGTMSGRWGTWLVSLVGGAPRWVGTGGGVSGGGVAFFAGGDSLLVSPGMGIDTIQYVRVASLSGLVRDSIAVRSAGLRFAGVGAIPGTSWIEVTFIRTGTNRGERRIIDRNGRETARAAIPLGASRNSADALWISDEGPADQSVITRVAFDRARGVLASQVDTVYVGRFTSFSVTEDGAALVVDDGTYQHSVYALSIADALAGHFPDQRRLLQGSTNVRALISPEGGRVLLGRTIPTTSGRPDYRWTLMPFDGGPESPLAVPSNTQSAFWVDSATVATIRAEAGRSTFALVNAATGAARFEFSPPDSTVWDFAPLRDGGWAWLTGNGSIQARVGGRTVALPRPAWYEVIIGMSTSPAGRIAYRGWNAGTTDTMGVSAVSPPDTASASWYSQFTDDGRVLSLDDGTILFLAWETAENVTLVHLSAPGTARRLGTIPRPVVSVGVSSDLKRASVTTRDYFGDAWMMRVTGRAAK